MEDALKFPLLAVSLRHDRHVVQARQRARDLAAELGFEHQDQIRLATAASELARNAFRYAGSGVVEFAITTSAPQTFVISVTDTGQGISNLDDILGGRYISKTGLGMGLIGTKRLMDHFDIVTSKEGTRVECGRPLPPLAPTLTPASIKAISAKLLTADASNPFDEVERQNQELLKTLAELKEYQEQLANMNRELEDTNRGVVALYAELENHAEDLRKVSDLKTSFLSNLSHEFRTPLNSILSLSKLLIGRADGDLTIEQEKQIGYIQHSAAELADLVNDLLDLAKVEAGKIDVKPRHFEVSEFFGALRGMLKPLLAGNSVDLMFDIPSEVPPLFTDEGKVSQVLRNLISNALKFTRKGHIRVTAETEEGGWIAFSVADTGIGIAPEDQQRIFQEFEQVEGEFQSQVKGTGLGLPLSRRLTELLGGTLTVVSTPGLGSTFTARVPAHFGTAPAQSLMSLADQNPHGPLVFFIEDNQETSFVHQSALRHSKYRTIFVTNIPEARVAMKSLQPQLVVLDRQIEGRDCLDFIGELRSSGYDRPVLVVSVINDEAAAIESGAAAFLAKPVPPFTLLNTVRELVEGKTSKTVLLVDDDEVSRYLVGGTLAKAGYRVVEAHGGRAALKVIEKDTPHAIILDLAMPDMNGFEILREIRKGSTRAVPVIIHSSRDLTAQDRKLLSDAATFIYSKQDFSSGSDGGAAGLLNLLAASGVEL